MNRSNIKTVAIAGNPNGGKSSLFNNLTGMNQKVGNYSGVTVDKKEGSMLLDNFRCRVIDLPGTYSIFAKTDDERVSMEVLLDPDHSEHPDMVIVVIDATHLVRNLLFFTQVRDLGIPCMIALTMNDIAAKKGIKIDINEMQRQLQVPVVNVNPRYNKGTKELMSVINASKFTPPPVAIELQSSYEHIAGLLRQDLNAATSFGVMVQACDLQQLRYISEEKKIDARKILEKENFSVSKFQAENTYLRYQDIKSKVNNFMYEESKEEKVLMAEKLDRILLHKFWGGVILIITLFLVFQSIYTLAAGPMEWIESFFQVTGAHMKEWLPTGWFTDLLVDGVWTGLSGVAIFIPQIAILFGLINLLEDSGYMSRISFLTDHILRKVGLSGRSAMPLISSMACAVPAIMATRTIPNKKERLISIMVTPLMSCSARLPVYVILIGLLIPQKFYFNFIGLQGLVLLLVYFIGIFFTLATAWIMKFFVKGEMKNYFILELPIYRKPRLRNVLMAMWEKTRIFVLEAGKVIVVISMILWFLASYGPSEKMDAVNTYYDKMYQSQTLSKEEVDHAKASALLETSYAGMLGKFIEPVIKPLGFDWKIGIALISSFAAREVFVGTMSTIYSLGDGGSDEKLMQKMRSAKDENGNLIFTFSTGMALLMFYILAMQCMSTLAIVKRETRSWKWPMIQLGYMSVLAYTMAFLVKILLS